MRTVVPRADERVKVGLGKKHRGKAGVFEIRRMRRAARAAGRKGAQSAAAPRLTQGQRPVNKGAAGGFSALSGPVAPPSCARVYTRWLLAAACLTASGTAFANEAAPAASAPAAPEDAYVSTQNYLWMDNGKTVVAMPDDRGNPVLAMPGARLEARRIVFDSRTRSASAEGEVKVDLVAQGSFPGLRLLADGAQYSNALRRLDTGHVRMGHPPLLIEAGKVSVLTATAMVDTTRAGLGDVRLYFNEPDLGVISVSGSSVSYDRATDTLSAEDVTLRIGPIPILYLPSYSQQGLDLPPFDPEIRVGSNNRYGTFLQTTTFYTGSKRWQPGLLLDGYGKAGVLAGPALRYDTLKPAPGESATYNAMKGDLRVGFIHDHSDRGLDQFDRPIPEDRHFVEWKHKQTLADTVEVTGALHWWSDPFATRDFRRRLFNENQQPDNFVELVVPDRAYYLSAFVRHSPNDFQDVNQRLPEVRFDLNPREIGDTRIYQRGHVSLAYLREETSDELPALPGTADDTLATPRVDAYYGLSRPITPSSAFSFTPVAGVRSTTWFDAVNGDATYSRLAGQVGFDSQATANGKWDYENSVWEINGLRHLARPVVQYRYLPGVTDGASRIPRIDRWSFLTAPPPIDLQQRRDTDELHETQILRLGFENLFQTRDKDYGSRDLVGLDVYQDIRDTDRAGDRTLSDTYIRQKLTPAYWLSFEMYERISPYTGSLNELSTQTTFTDGDRWKLRFGTQHVSDVAVIDQYLLGWDYRIDSQYSLKALWRFDADTGTLAEQSYGVVQQLGHSWQIEYSVGHSRNAREDSGTRFGLHLRLNTF